MNNDSHTCPQWIYPPLYKRSRNETSTLWRLDDSRSNYIVRKSKMIDELWLIICNHAIIIEVRVRSRRCLRKPIKYYNFFHAAKYIACPLQIILKIHGKRRMTGWNHFHRIWTNRHHLKYDPGEPMRTTPTRPLFLEKRIAFFLHTRVRSWRKKPRRACFFIPDGRYMINHEQFARWRRSYLHLNWRTLEYPSQWTVCV